MSEQGLDSGIELHRQILAGSDIALSRLYVLYGEEIVKKLKLFYPVFARQDINLLYTAINEALWGYFRNPATFDPGKNTLLRFLEIAAERDLINILHKEEKYLTAKKAPEDVELEANFWNRLIKDYSSADEGIILQEAMEEMNKILGSHFHSERDIKLAKLIISQAREVNSYVLVLRIEHLNREDQKAEVKRHKDRIKKTLERHSVIEKLKRLMQ